MSLPLFSRTHAASPLQWILRLAGLGAAWTAFNPPVGAGEVSGRINVLLLLADNWAYPHSSFLGDRTVKTPNFDRLAREGVFFRHAFCPVPSCSPTRASILTGREPHELGEAVNLWSGLPTTYPSLTQELRRTGYDVGYTGKGWAPGNHVASGWSENPVGTRHGSLKEFLDQRSATHPFFFWIGNLDTAIGHWDYDAGATADLDPSSVVVPAHLPDLPEVRHDILAYYNGVRKFDRLIGESRDLLERNGLLENTVIVCVSDNGWQVPRGLANCYD
ncbi:MAG: sulfatase-like hydrolase/transferase, partial [Opitutaceae bacterium]|nr:sulfatase-like hydrolase/transferase [Opitutaceae bacterium]